MSEIQRYLHYNVLFVFSNGSALHSRIIPRKEWFLGLKIKKTYEVCVCVRYRLRRISGIAVVVEAVAIDHKRIA